MNSLPFNTENARAWHEGRKTQHRELMKPQSSEKLYEMNNGGWRMLSDIDGKNIIKCPYKVGEKVFIQEDWGVAPCYNYFTSETIPLSSARHISYRCDQITDNHHNNIDKWRDPKAMPEKYSRSTAIITCIRVERIQSITEEDCEAEGIVGVSAASPINALPVEHYYSGGLSHNTPREAYESMWGDIYGDESWQHNYWVWVYELKKGGE